MKKKIGLWLVKNFALFGVAKLLQEQKNFELFGITDTNENLKNLFSEQKIVNFKKLWFYENHHLKYPDYEYLEQFEKKYELNLSFVASTERYFYKQFNPYHHFSKDEIMSILEQECRLFESIIFESELDLIFSTPITNHAQYLFYRICKKSGIDFLTLEPMRFYNRYMISNGLIFDLDSTHYFEKNFSIKKTQSEINDFMKTFAPFHYVNPYYSKNSIRKLEKMKALIEFPFLKNDSSTRFSKKGRTKKNILFRGTKTLNNIQLKNRKKFIDKNLIKEPDLSKPYIYFPLHVEPEKILFMGTPYLTNQLSVIQNISKSIPSSHKLYVKEHPGMKNQGWRDSKFYQEIMNIFNITLIHPEVTSKQLIQNSSLVITIFGTAALESAFYKKPSIVFRHDVGYSLIPSIKIVTDFNELQDAIKISLKKDVDLNELSDYVNFIEKITFELPFDEYIHNVANTFNYNLGYLNEISISEDELKIFLNNNNDIYKKITNEFLKTLEKSKL